MSINNEKSTDDGITNTGGSHFMDKSCDNVAQKIVINDDQSDTVPLTSLIPDADCKTKKFKNAHSSKRKRRRLSEKDVQNCLAIEFDQEKLKLFHSAISTSFDPVVSPVVFEPGAKKRRHYPLHSAAHKTKDLSASTSSVVEPSSDAANLKEVEKDLLDSKETKTDAEVEVQVKRNPNGDKFRYGNYNRYYGKRIPVQLPGVSLQDPLADNRLNYFDKKWFENKRVLDIGCNIGLVTLHIAKYFQPKCIVGVDIDPHLIGVARKNIRHYMDEAVDVKTRRRFPDSFSKEYGPLAAPPLPSSSACTITLEFPTNIMFKTANYVPDNDTVLEMVQPEYEVILAMSISKWVHLNWGDDGLKRFFRRIFKHLHPGGVLIFEPQPFVSYKRRKKLTPEIAENFNKIQFTPDQFNSYLLSEEVGFVNSQVVANPEHRAKGFCRPIFMLQKKT